MQRSLLGQFYQCQGDFNSLLLDLNESPQTVVVTHKFSFNMPKLSGLNQLRMYLRSICNNARFLKAENGTWTSKGSDEIILETQWGYARSPGYPNWTCS